jgi:hypothetical protein
MAKAKGSKRMDKGGACFMRFNAQGQPYRICKSSKELKMEKERAKKNKKKAIDKVKATEEKRKKELEELKKKRDANKNAKGKKTKK